MSHTNLSSHSGKKQQSFRAKKINELIYKGCIIPNLFSLLVTTATDLNMEHKIEKQRGRYLDTAGKHFMQHVSSSFHQPHVGWCWVKVLAVSDRIHKTITELFARSEKTRFYKTHHAMICTNTSHISNLLITMDEKYCNARLFLLSV